MENIKKQALIERIMQNSLTEEDKSKLVSLVENENFDELIKYILKVCKLGMQAWHLFDP